jgi:hypothetical protein
MSKSYAEMADEILNGALSNPVKNPYDPAVGHQAHMPAMDPNDTLLEMTDSQRNQLNLLLKLKLVLPLLRKLFNLLKRSFKLFQKPKE